MSEEHPHVRLLRELSSQIKPLFERSPEGIYLYIDEVHKICNERLARMFGLSVAEWEAMEGFVNIHVDEADQDRFISNYQEHIHHTSTPVRFRFTGIRKDRSSFQAETDMIPLAWGGEMLAFHFVREIP